MAGLSQQECAPCRGDEPPLDRDAIDEMMRDIDDAWRLDEQDGVPRIRRRFKVKGFQPAIDLTVAVGRIAEEQGHHPTIVTQWGSVTVEWWTHKIKGLHANDFIMAARTDELYARFQG